MSCEFKYKGLYMILTKEYLESLIVEDHELRLVFDETIKIVDENLLFSTKKYGKIEATIPLYRKYFNDAFEMNFKGDMFELSTALVKNYKARGFNVFVLNGMSTEDISLFITNKDVAYNNVSNKYGKNEEPIFEKGLRA